MPEALGDLEKNASVFIKNLNKEGVLLSDPEKRCKDAEVQIGIMKMRVPWDQIFALPKKEIHKRSKYIHSSESSSSVPRELKLLGLRVDEALAHLEHYLDQVVQQGIPEVRIVHGTGTGALKQAVRKYLNTSGYPIKYHDAAQNEGGAGATIVTLEE